MKDKKIEKFINNYETKIKKYRDRYYEKIKQHPNGPIFSVRSRLRSGNLQKTNKTFC